MGSGLMGLITLYHYRVYCYKGVENNKNYIENHIYGVWSYENSVCGLKHNDILHAKKCVYCTVLLHVIFN